MKLHSLCNDYVYLGIRGESGFRPSGFSRDGADGALILGDDAVGDGAGFGFGLFFFLEDLMYFRVTSA